MSRGCVYDEMDKMDEISCQWAYKKVDYFWYYFLQNESDDDDETRVFYWNTVM